MAAIVYDLAGKVRDKPVNQRLQRVLLRAAEASEIDTVLVTSGGQPGTSGKRVGSTRHDDGNAADLQLLRGGKALNFTDSNELPLVEKFVTAAAANGATGIGAGIAYMGPKTLHVGFGSKAVWGKGGKSANAPEWLKEAAKKGWDNPVAAESVDFPEIPPAQPSSEPGQYFVNVRDTLHLRGGPGLEFAILKSLKAGTEVTVIAFDGAASEWARVDIEGDGVIDGYLHGAFLMPANLEEHSDEAETDIVAGLF